MRFAIRKTGADLKDKMEYASYSENQGNPYYPEAAPHYVGGTMSDKLLTNKDAKGNCTWYAFGRYFEVFGVRPEYPTMRGSAYEWGTKGERLSDYAEVGGIVVFHDGGFGHVAFIENIVDGRVYVSESAYSTRGNDFLFRNDRTVAQICDEWGMWVARYIAPYESSVSYDPDSNVTLDELVQEVIAGEWGNDPERSERLAAAGHHPETVQIAVNNYLNGGGQPQPSKSVAEVAKEVNRGEWGNGQERVERLEAAGYNYDEVQAEVNRINGVPESAALAAGDKVQVVNAVNYDNDQPFDVWHDVYDLIEVSGYRGVIAYDGGIVSAVDIRNLRKA